MVRDRLTIYTCYLLAIIFMSTGVYLLGKISMSALFGVMFFVVGMKFVDAAVYGQDRLNKKYNDYK